MLKFSIINNNDDNSLCPINNVEFIRQRAQDGKCICIHTPCRLNNTMDGQRQCNNLSIIILI